MLVIRLQRTGRENTPTYRIVVSEKARSARKGKLEILGHYIASGSKTEFVCDKERVAHWVKHGAKPSDTVARLLAKAGVADMQKYFIRYAKQRSKKEAPAAEASAAPAAA